MSAQDPISAFDAAVQKKLGNTATAPIHPDIIKGFADARMPSLDPVTAHAGAATPALSEFPTEATAGDIAKTQTRNVAIGALEPFSARDVNGNWKIPDAISGIGSGIKSALTGNALGIASAAKGMIEAPIEPIKNLVSGDWQKAAEGAGGFATTTVPAIEGAVKGARGGMNAVASTDRAQAIRTRAIQSILKPDKAAFDFGADPVKEVASLPPSSDIKGLQKNVRFALDQHEIQLQQAISQSPGSANVEPLIRSQAQPILDQANRWGNRATVKTINNAIDSYVADLKARRSTTNLTGSDVLEEKRMLNKEIKFDASDIRAQNLNAVKVGVYRALDKALDSIAPAAKEINQSYSGLVEADHLLKRRALERGNADLTGKSAFQTVAGLAPDVAVKTHVADALTPKSAALVPKPLVSPRTTAPVAPFVTAHKPAETAEEYLKRKGLK